MWRWGQVQLGRRTEPPPVPHNSPLQPLYLRSKWRPVVPTDCVLFGAKGEHGIDGRGSASRQVAGKEGNGEKQQARGYDG